MTDTFDPVNRPKHYNSHPSGVETKEVVRHLSFNVGNAVKHLWRAGLKDSSPELQDLEKCAWYLRDEIAELESSMKRGEQKAWYRSRRWIAIARKVATGKDVLSRVLTTLTSKFGWIASLEAALVEVEKEIATVKGSVLVSDTREETPPT